MGKIMKNGIKYSSEANTLSVELTRAQYDALSEADKMKDIYYYVEDEEPFTTNNAAYGYTPIGTIIHVMGNHAPKNYLACNGQVVDILDYPELSQYFEEEFSSINKFGGDGVTTFGLPDLRGEFLRGTGTNSHTNQGNGANVGSHQDATTIPVFNTYKASDTGNYGLAVRVDAGVTGVQNIVDSVDKITKSASSANAKNMFYTSTSLNATTATANEGTVKPTNTSVLYCIAYKNIYITPENLYSTDEKVVGTWIDGKPIYQKTVNFGNLPNNTTKSVAHEVSNIDKIISYDAITTNGTNFYTLNCCWTNGTSNISSNVSRENITIITTNNYTSYTAYVTFQYTKTTD